MATNFFYTIVDILFNTMHIFAILINCFGWAFKKTLRIINEQFLLCKNNQRNNI